MYQSTKIEVPEGLTSGTFQLDGVKLRPREQPRTVKFLDIRDKQSG